MKTDSEQVAKAAGLVMSDRFAPGISRDKVELETGDGEKPKISWRYFLSSGK